jgi:DNA-binding CsgD family transcriptional regulator
VLVAVEYQADLRHIDAGRQKPVQIVRISRHAKSKLEHEQIIKIEPEMNEGGDAARVLDKMRVDGYPLSQFHTPHSFEYYYNEEYVGLLILFRDKSRTPVSQETLDAIQALHPFFTFILAHLVMRSRFFNPSNPLFYDSLESLLTEAKLSNQQLRIVTHLLLGRSYKEIAGLLSIAEGTVKKQLNLIYQKTGTHGQNELFAKYFAPRLAG